VEKVCKISRGELLMCDRVVFGLRSTRSFARPSSPTSPPTSAHRSQATHPTSLLGAHTILRPLTRNSMALEIAERDEAGNLVLEYLAEAQGTRVDVIVCRMHISLSGLVLRSELPPQNLDWEYRSKSWFNP
jgi:hypothetical protein